MRKGDFILTGQGIEFYPLDPRKEEISIKDIAHALSLTCRGNGHLKRFYSVAQHCILCAKEAKNRGYSKRIQLACLLHDASEAYMSDITRPVKKELSDYLVIEEKLQGFLYEVLGVPNLTKEELQKVKVVDDAMLRYEMIHLLNYDGIVAEDVVEEYDLNFKMMSEVEDEYIKLVEELQ